MNTEMIRLWCRPCGRSVSAKISARTPEDGWWPKCCGIALTTDHPSTWEPGPITAKALAADAQRQATLEATAHAD